MRRLMRWLPAALVFVALALAMFQPNASRTVRADDIHERCADCLRRLQQHYEQCQAQFGFDVRCDEQYNRDVVNCHRQFCEQ
ncbi:MAG TPA: hypothetical protein VN282_06845 [Pyrinomonadaceae bacterium]|nr:hypothetical protein [Pyrinomonadaceae bacterium]